MRERRRATISDSAAGDRLACRGTRGWRCSTGIARNEIIVGAYSDAGGICPMLAAHRAGGRTDCIAFAKAWDRFAFGGGRRIPPRPAARPSASC